MPIRTSRSARVDSPMSASSIPAATFSAVCGSNRFISRRYRACAPFIRRRKRRWTGALVPRAQAAGRTAIFLTVDSPPGRNSETLLRAIRHDARDCTQCHIGGLHGMWRQAPLFAGMDVSGVTQLAPTFLSEKFLERLRKLVTVKFLVKGIVTAEDATLAMQAGADGVVVSNHGGWQEGRRRSPTE